MKISQISFHPKLVAFLDLFLGFVLLWWLGQINTAWMIVVWFVFRILLWVGFIRVMYYPREVSRLRHLVGLFFFVLGWLSFAIFTDWLVAQKILDLIFLIIPFFGFWLLPTSEISVNALLKPHLRWCWFMSIIGLAGVFSGFAALIAFQIISYNQSWLGCLVGATLAAVIAAWWWKEYEIKIGFNFYIWSISIIVLMAELNWIINALPIGYLVSGAFLTWCWYVIWLIARYNMTTVGIKWQKQARFILINIGLMALYLIFIIKWK